MPIACPTVRRNSSHVRNLRNKIRASRYRGRMTDDDDEIGTPNCDSCLTHMELVGPISRPYWECPSCGLTRIL